MAVKRKLRPWNAATPGLLPLGPESDAPAAPVVTSPTDGTTFGIGSVVTLSATTTDTDADRIDWILDPSGAATVIGSDLVAPYTQPWTAAGSATSHVLIARSVRGGKSTDSAPISITLASYPVPLADFPSSGIVQSGGLVTDWTGTNGKAWQTDTTQAWYAKPAYVANMGGGNPGAQGGGQTPGARRIMKLNTTNLKASGPASFGLVISNVRDQASPGTTRGYVFVGGIASGNEPEFLFPEICNDGFASTGGNIGYFGGTGVWIPITETNFDGSTNRVSVVKGLQVLVWSINPGVTLGSWIMRNGNIIGYFTAPAMAMDDRITLLGEPNGDDSDQSYTRSTVGDHAVWDVTLTQTQAQIWSTEKMTKFSVTDWPPTGQVLPTWANPWYDASRSSDFVRGDDRALSKVGNRASPGTHVGTQNTAADKPFLQPCADGASQHQGMVFQSTDNFAAHTVSALIDGTDDFTIAVIARASNTTNTDGRLIRAVNSGGGSAIIHLENPYAEPPTEPTLATRHDGTNNVTVAGPAGNALVHFWVFEKTSNVLRIGRDGLYKSVTQTQASITIDQFFIGGGTSNQEIFSIAIKAGGNATTQQLVDEHARAVSWWGARALPSYDEPWQYSSSAWFEPGFTLGYHEDGSAAGTADRMNDLAGSNVSVSQATDANNPTIAGTGLGVYLDFDGSNDELSVGQAISLIVSTTAWEIYAVIWIDTFDTNSANFESNDVVIGDVGFWGLHIRNNAGGQVQAAQWDGARKVAAATITSGAWHTVHAYYDGVNINLEVDGVAATPAAAGSITLLTGTLKVGGSTANTTQQFDGRIRHISVFNVNLSAGGRTAMATRCNAIRDAA